MHIAYAVAVGLGRRGEIGQQTFKRREIPRSVPDLTDSSLRTSSTELGGEDGREKEKEGEGRGEKDAKRRKASTRDTGW